MHMYRFSWHAMSLEPVIMVEAASWSQDGS